MSDSIQLVIHGAAGRMGRRLIDLGHADARFQLVAAVESAECELLGQDAGAIAGIGEIGLPLSAEFPAADAIIDFSTPAGAASALAAATDRAVPLVLATTALSDDQRAAVTAAATRVPVVYAPNMSMAVNLTMKLAEQAAAALKDHSSGLDVEILERHHRFKEDAPSGTALKFGELIAAAAGKTGHQHGRHGMTGLRPLEEIGYHAIRTGDNPGEHTIVFGMLGETIELTVRASNRDCYARGALAAAAWLIGRPPGLYSMVDVLGLD